MLDVGEKIRVLRKKLDYTQQELAEKSGVAAVTIQQYERGVRVPKIDILVKIADALDVDINYFLHDNYSDNSDSVGEKIRIARINARMTKADVARKMGIAYSTYDGYEKGYRTPKIEVLRNIADALKVSLADILDISNKEEKKEIDILYEKLNDLGKSKLYDYLRFLLTDKENRYVKERKR